MEGTKTHEEMLAELIGKAAADDGFRARLVEDPKAAIKEALNVDLPESLTVHVHEDTARAAHLVLPSSASLTEAQLEAIAAGHRSGQNFMYDNKEQRHRHGSGGGWHT